MNNMRGKALFSVLCVFAFVGVIVAASMSVLKEIVYYPATTAVTPVNTSSVNPNLYSVAKYNVTGGEVGTAGEPYSILNAATDGQILTIMVAGPLGNDAYLIFNSPLHDATGNVVPANEFKLTGSTTMTVMWCADTVSWYVIAGVPLGIP